MRSDLDWAVPATAFVFVQFVIGSIVASAIGYEPTPPTLLYLRWSSIVALFALAVFTLVQSHRLWRTEEQVDSLTAFLRPSLPKLAITIFGCYLVGLQFASLAWLKSMLPLAVPFWADPYLASLDRILFLGTDPWKTLHHLPKAAEEVVDAVYLLWFPIKAWTLIALLSLPPNGLKSRALLAYFITIGLFGVCGQYLLSSAGPIFYEKFGFGDDFKHLKMTATVLMERDYLWGVYTYRHVNFGGGISAMPSVHVALACWLALTLRSIWPKAQVMGWTFFAMICFGSVYLGWHYVSDGIVGTAAALLSWKLSKAFLEREWHFALRRPYAPQV